MFKGAEVSRSFAVSFIKLTLLLATMFLLLSLLNSAQAQIAEGAHPDFNKRSVTSNADQAEFYQNRFLGALAGIGAIIGLLFLVWIMCEFSFSKRWPDDRKAAWKEKINVYEKILRAPFHFAITPIGRYSISLVQILWWTLIIIFTCVFIYATKREVMACTPQILILLGISSATSISSKINSVGRFRDIPEKFSVAFKQSRIPRFADLVCIDNIPSVFKFQILAFTLIAGVYALIEVYSNGIFPVFDTEILTLMGISSGVYLANEMTHSNIWAQIEADIKRFDVIMDKIERASRYVTVKEIGLAKRSEIKILISNKKTAARKIRERIVSRLKDIYE